MSASESVDKRLIVGLGNPGARYQSTRHNCGFWVVEELAKRWSLRTWQSVCNALLASAAVADLALPQTFMNRSGFAVRCLADELSYAPENILVVYDDVALPLGTLRLRGRGSPGGHRGLESIVESMSTLEIPRLRLGIQAPAPERPSLATTAPGVEGGAEPGLKDFVLSPFSSEEQPMVDAMVQRAADACESWLEAGLETTMNQFNGNAA